MSDAFFATKRPARNAAPFASACPTSLLLARRTTRLRTEQRRLGLEVGGEAGARLAQRQGMPVSPATLLRLARRDPLPIAPTPRVLGVDDFSLRKGQVFGTILVNLERRQPIDLLPDRTAASLATWLEQHPGVTIISRDRAAEYTDGATRGAAAAVQVADRFDLLQNLREALQRVLEQQVAAIEATHAPPAEPIVPIAAEQLVLSAHLSNAAPTALLGERSRRERLQAESRAVCTSASMQGRTVGFIRDGRVVIVSTFHRPIYTTNSDEHITPLCSIPTQAAGRPSCGWWYSAFMLTHNPLS